MAFNDINQEIYDRNAKLYTIALNNNIEFIDISKYICNTAKKYCKVLTDEGTKTYFNRDHWTVDGAKYFMNDIYNGELNKLLQISRD